MSDIVEKLHELERVERELAHECDCPPEATANWKYAETCKEAASEITRLRAALRKIADMIPHAMPDYTHQVWKTARAALGGKDD